MNHEHNTPMSASELYAQHVLSRYADTRQKRTATTLTYSGILPFLFITLLLAFHVRFIPLLGNTTTIISAYTLIIATFLAGAHWGQHLERNNPWSLYLPVASNVNAVVLWLCYLTLPFTYLCFIFCASFAVLLYIDRTLFHAGLINDHYFQTRCIVTSIVIVLLLLSAFFVR